VPFSYGGGKYEIQKFIAGNIPPGSTILDVGPGAAVYHDLLSENGYVIDCIDIFKPNIERFDLLEKYRMVALGDVRNFDVGSYDFVIFGDVLEHMEVSEAVKLINASKRCVVAVPYLWKQGPSEGNAHEEHIQDDLTPELMLERYPMLSPVVICNHEVTGEPVYGYYHKGGRV
tara:strand:+ start:27392 stop:27910 length:519 start_codon:yes stop_codon:yes gene_type:complete